MNLLTIYIEAIQMKGTAHMHVLSICTLHARMHAGAYACTGRFMHIRRLAHVHTQSNLPTAKPSKLLFTPTIRLKRLRQTNTTRWTHDELLLELLEEELEEEEEEELDELEDDDELLLWLLLLLEEDDELDDDELQSGHVRSPLEGHCCAVQKDLAGSMKNYLDDELLLDEDDELEEDELHNIARVKKSAPNHMHTTTYMSHRLCARI
jgi:hypothetical protein